MADDKPAGAFGAPEYEDLPWYLKPLHGRLYGNAATGAHDYMEGQFEAGDNKDLLSGVPQAKGIIGAALSPLQTAKSALSGAWDFLGKPIVEGGVRSLVAQEGPPVFDDGGQYVSGSNMEKLDPFNFASAFPIGAFGARAAGLATDVGDVGMFAGRGARTADHAKLAQAEKMAAEGAPREQIWSDTGWFQGVDGKWRFEIDDSGMKHVIPLTEWIPPREPGKPFMAPNLEQAYMKAASQLTPTAPVRMKRLFEHSELDAAYKYGLTNSDQHQGIMGMPVQLMEGGSSSGALINGKTIGMHETLPPGPARSTALHEMQHAIQNKEGFAPGSNPDLFTTEKLKQGAFEDHSRKIQELMAQDPEAAQAYRALNQFQARVRGTPAAATDEALDEVNRLEEALLRYPIGRQLSDMDWTRASVQSYPDDRWRSVAMDKYRSIAGEVEARTTQKRAPLTAEERAARPPWLDYDVPESDQIVKLFANDSRSSLPAIVTQGVESAQPQGVRAYHWSPEASEIGPDNRFFPMSHFGSQKAAKDRFEALTPDEELLPYYDDPVGGTIPVDLNIQNPLRVPDIIDHTNPTRVANMVDAALKPSFWQRLSPSHLARDVAGKSQEEAAAIVDAALGRHGYDGLVYKNVIEGGGDDSYIATRPGTVKSATTGETLFANDSKAALPGVIVNAAEELPMDQASRLARAREMGFDTDELAYRGLTRPYDEDAAAKQYYQMFTSSPAEAGEYAMGNPLARPNVVPAYLRKGRNLDVDARSANFNAVPTDGLPESIRAKLRGDFARTDEIAHAARELGYDSATIRDVIDNATNEKVPVPQAGNPQMETKRAVELDAILAELGMTDLGPPVVAPARGYEGVAPHERGPATINAIFDPRNVRSPNAAFDPANADSMDLLAANPALAGVPANILSLYDRLPERAFAPGED